MAKLYLEKLKCVTTEGWSGFDEPRLVVQDRGTVWNGTVLGDRMYTVKYDCDFTGRIAVSLWDDGGPDGDGRPGRQWITDTPGERSLHFRADGAEYRLLFAVE
ncbi:MULTISPECIES: hypothetical protein [unclassified Streptomyces]|uniref:hypothetical protein n=1 Tax=unclassified Streptomyces TaxID=2593676 RepID=UPI000C274D3F|nr:hypothetical protein [Streptomyces sp. CB02959]PJN39481.1 hypothetical protein CG747_16060 [Streptomyces sp. CB02959]